MMYLSADKIKTINESQILNEQQLKEIAHQVSRTDLSEIKPIKLGGNVCYVEQQAWIQNMTIRDNILFGKSYDEKLYMKTLVAC